MSGGHAGDPARVTPLRAHPAALPDNQLRGCLGDFLKLVSVLFEFVAVWRRVVCCIYSVLLNHALNVAVLRRLGWMMLGFSDVWLGKGEGPEFKYP